ncbi:hypothetical protein K7X08_025129 [Anisodus acutangulus]|uniref:XPG N-terminal domain-containing protein n=1 Tax=Anisodus acutangulus TaxID=402998 RepID=A0A9Q1RDK6_9SOLA|nr:hypothetical protein K7X08_025129 [Anisodus acutangulus]
MGVKNLWDILESCKKTLPFHHLQNKRVCIDLSCWIVQLANVNKSHCAMKETLYLRGLFHRLRALIALNCSLIFVTGNLLSFLSITLAVILGGDYSEGVYGLGRESACQIVKSIGDSAVLQWIASEGSSFVKKRKGSKRQTEDDKCNDRENAIKILMEANALHKRKVRPVSFGSASIMDNSNNGFSAVCFLIINSFFDEYILPKIAERELRRFANLRSTASQLGVQLPLDEMPIKCPLSRIIKPRKAQGVDCFEVSWEQMDGLETSIVPADLVQRACPERILEFQERRAQGKKRNTNRSRPRKLEKTPLGQIDQKLQDLLLEIDREGSATNYTTFLCGSVSEDDESFAQIQLVDPGIQSHDTWNSNSVKKGGFTSGSAICQESNVLPASSEDEVIDLTSPPPLRHASGNSKVQEDKVQRMDVIELSDSENDMFSREHTRARELRMFIAGIKDTTY